METNVSVIFKNLIFSSLDYTSAAMELSYENKNVKFIYPLKEPIKITFSPKFITDKINLTLSVTEIISKKKKLSFRSDLVLNKTIFSEGNSSYEKIVTLIPTDFKDIKKAGKIYMEIHLLDPIDSWEINSNTPKRKGNQKQNNQQSNNKAGNEKKSLFDDNISLVNVSKIEDDNEFTSINTLSNNDDLLNTDYMNQIKHILETEHQRILPNDINSLKLYNQNLYNKYRELEKQYNEVLTGISSTNEQIRNKTVNYWNNYKELKKKLYKMRVDFANNKNKIENEKKINNQENLEISNNLENYRKEKDIFLNKLSNGPGGATDANNLAVISSGTNNSDIKMLSDAIKKISGLGFDIIEGMKINEEERKLLSVIIGTNLCDNIVNEDEKERGNEGEEQGQEVYDENNIKEDFEFGNKIVALIERDVNELYSRKLIHQIKIDQIDAITYSFSDDSKEKNVSFKIDNNNLFCIDSGESFTIWLLSNFST